MSLKIKTKMNQNLCTEKTKNVDKPYFDKMKNMDKIIDNLISSAANVEKYENSQFLKEFKSSNSFLKTKYHDNEKIRIATLNLYTKYLVKCFKISSLAPKSDFLCDLFKWMKKDCLPSLKTLKWTILVFPANLTLFKREIFIYLSYGHNSIHTPLVVTSAQCLSLWCRVNDVSNLFQLSELSLEILIEMYRKIIVLFGIKCNVDKSSLNFEKGTFYINVNISMENEQFYQQMENIIHSCLTICDFNYKIPPLSKNGSPKLNTNKAVNILNIISRMYEKIEFSGRLFQLKFPRFISLFYLSSVKFLSILFNCFGSRIAVMCPSIDRTLSQLFIFLTSDFLDENEKNDMYLQLFTLLKKWCSLRLYFDDKSKLFSILLKKVYLKHEVCEKNRLLKHLNILKCFLIFMGQNCHFLPKTQAFQLINCVITNVNTLLKFPHINEYMSSIEEHLNLGKVLILRGDLGSLQLTSRLIVMLNFCKRQSFKVECQVNEITRSLRLLVEPVRATYNFKVDVNETYQQVFLHNDCEIDISKDKEGCLSKVNDKCLYGVKKRKINKIDEFDNEQMEEKISNEMMNKKYTAQSFDTDHVALNDELADNFQKEDKTDIEDESDEEYQHILNSLVDEEALDKVD